MKIKVLYDEGNNWEFVFHKGMHLHHPNKRNYGGDYLCSKCIVMAVF